VAMRGKRLWKATPRTALWWYFSGFHGRSDMSKSMHDFLLANRVKTDVKASNLMLDNDF